MTMSETPSRGSREMAAVIAAHRFGLGEADFRSAGADPVAWLAAQIGPADPARGQGLARLSDGIRAHAAFIQTQRRPVQTAATNMAAMAADTRSGEQQFGDHFRPIVQADVRSHLATAIVSARPFAERLSWFWSNHFTVSMAKASARALVGAFEREAIRPHIASTFGEMLRAAVTHGAMIR